MGLRKNESLLIIYDENKAEIAKDFLKQSKKISSKVKLMQIPVAKVNSQEPPEHAAKEMLKYGVIIMLTTKSLSHTLARKNACERGARIASMPNILKETLKRAILIDYDELRKRTQRIKGIFEKGSFVRVTSNKGTDITMKIRKGALFTDTGIYKEKSEWGNIPGGEFAISPLEGTAEGIFFVDASMAGVQKLKNPIKVTVKKGFAVKIEGGREAEELKKLLEGLKDPNVYNIAELGIGTNDKAKVSGNILEDEKVLGTAHIALGDNFSLKGNIRAATHLDGVFHKPTIYVDAKKIMENGRLLV